MMESFHFYKDRIKFGLTKKYICFLEKPNRTSRHNSIRISIYDPVDQSYKRLPRFHRLPEVSYIINVNHKIVLLGAERDINPILIIYDLLSNTWKYGAEFPIPTPSGLGFACCASPDGSIYIAGGLARSGLSLGMREAAVYKVDEDRWEILLKMYYGMYSCRGVFIEGMFYVMSLRNLGCQRFDPRTRKWTMMFDMSLPSLCCKVLYAFGRLIAYGIKGIMQYDWQGRIWRELDPIPGNLSFSSRATVWCDRIFFCGSFGILRMYKPGAPSSERWISLDVPKNFLEMNIVSITTIEI
ncbi:hypothetical protein SUGI_0678040 [Cryptomeria japonica]|uniref:F-box/kelch-repeat protein At1g26930-like n=1 Tax=Cryptomeria japonica TaxID=3369 RepID=UPI0024148F0D|nr:F-box/kelch-repeat protein At1g26930-like [Cryptomeria japonica]GLJ33727.1 hypothetical protein SUGI_0678040 [Cryptomeria japonica]